MVETINK